ncbi:LOW QUALITY PROTEIN: fumonisin B1 esterase-like [Aquarana catesbeiana]|uniref:LOW QUALITY PROTEIN: fumonisin B1 esterase-like n=1 Tax=Aquarana catesbeiana TaxID=8400 RepID=UPI003CC9C6F7
MVAIGVRIILLCLLAAGFAYLLGNSGCSTLVDVSTSCGMVCGHPCDHGYMFIGIAYAIPLTGPLRWRPPVELTCWNDTLIATDFKFMCAQVRPWSDKGTVMGSEDCLYVNVWTPSMNHKAKLRVMVWIHGGCLLSISGSEPSYSPNEDLVRESHIVHVSFNYRLNAFGFLALTELREESPTNTSGNHSTMHA